MLVPVLKKYSSIFWAITKASAIAEIEFRLNFVMKIINDIFWYAAQIFTFEVLFRHTNLIGDWNLQQTRVFLGVLFIVDAFYMTFIQENLDRFSEKVRKGELDLLLTKPVNSQFMITFARISVSCIGNLLIASTWFIWSLSQLPDFNWLKVFWIFLLVPAGFSVMYGIRFSIAAMAVVFVRVDSMQYVWYQLYRLGMRPDSIYMPWLKFILLTILPVALIASVPARAILNPPEIWVVAWSLIAGPLLIWFSTWFWKQCLLRYQSSSS